MLVRARAGLQARDRPPASPTWSTTARWARHLRHRRVGVLERLGPVADPRQDRHRRPQQGAVVRGLHPPGHDRGVGRLARRLPTRCPTTGGTPCSAATIAAPDLEGLHAAGDGGHAARSSSRRRARTVSRPSSASRGRRRSRSSQRRIQGRRHDRRLLPPGGHGRRTGRRAADARRSAASPSISGQQRRRADVTAPVRQGPASRAAEAALARAPPAPSSSTVDERPDARRHRVRREPRRRHDGPRGTSVTLFVWPAPPEPVHRPSTVQTVAAEATRTAMAGRQGNDRAERSRVRG